jgi:hypothetical protein
MFSKRAALFSLRRQLRELETLPREWNAPGGKFSDWYFQTRSDVQRAFGKNSRQFIAFSALNFVAPATNPRAPDADLQWWYSNGFSSAALLIESMLVEAEGGQSDGPVVGPRILNARDAEGYEGVRLFVSHQSSDATIAKAIADLCRDALHLRVRQIRCSSVDGYRLPGGADTAGQLRQEVLAAGAFVGIITPRTRNSPYVLFELGARWAIGEHLCPVLAMGADSRAMFGPLEGRNALNLSSRGEVVQMIEEISAVLGSSIGDLSGVQSQIAAVVSAATADGYADTGQASEPSRATSNDVL